MKKIKLIAIAACLSLAACATKHPGNQAVAIGAENKIPLKISGRIIDYDKDSAFQLIDLSIENQSDTWVRIDNARMVIDDEKTSRISAVVGPDLISWAESVREEKAREQHNTEILQTGLIVAGSVAAAAGGYNNDESLRAAGLLAIIGTSSWAVVDSLKMSQEKAQSSVGTPADHLYSSFSVPGKMLKRRWLLLNKPSKIYVNKLVLEFETTEGEKQQYAISL